MDLLDQIKRNKKNQSPKNIIKLLKAYGFEYRGTEGDHYNYKRKGFRPFPIPVSQNPLAIHIVQNAIRMIEQVIEIDGINHE